MLVSVNAATPFKKLPDRCLERAPSDEVTKAEEVFQSVLSHEIYFWNMSSGESQRPLSVLNVKFHKISV